VPERSLTLKLSSVSDLEACSAQPRRRRLRAVLLALFLCVAPGFAAANNCVDGGRPRPDDGGIGGTGARPSAPDDEGGIGGTGISLGSDTGIIGTITGFASVCVGGAEVRYAADTIVDVDGKRTTPADLAVGQVVEVTASGTGSELLAQHITVRHLVSGPVTRVDTDRNTIEVIGQTVELSSSTRTGGGSDQYAAGATAFPVNAAVQVSGMRRSDGVVVASRVTATEPGEVAQLTGAVMKLESGALAIAGTPVRIDTGEQPAVGDEVHVTGRWDGSALVAQSVESLPRIPFDGHVRRLDLEGYAMRSTAGQLWVGPFAVALSPGASSNVPQLPAPDTRVRIQAVVRDRQVIVERLGVIGDLPTLPPQPDRELRGSRAFGPNDGGHASGEPAPFDQPRTGEHGEAGPPLRDGMMAPQVPDAAGFGAPARPDRPDRPAPPQFPDRPQLPDRPARPEPPARPDRPQLPERPARPERPDIHARP